MKTEVLAKGAFDLNALRKQRAQKTTKVDLVAGISQISPEIAHLKVGETAVISGVDKENNRKVVMSITAKLSHLTSKDGAWEGKSFDVASDSDAGKVYIQRNSNLKPDQIKERKKGGGGRKRKAVAPEAAAEAVTEGATETVSAGEAVVKEHA